MLPQLVVFDGHCPFCHFWIRLLLRIDRHKRLRLCTYDVFRNAVPSHSLVKADKSESVLFIADGRTYRKSEAIIRSLIEIGGFWKFSRVLRFIPLKFRDYIYDAIAANRYRWFGRYESCPIPNPKHHDRFLDAPELKALISGSMSGFQGI